MNRIPLVSVIVPCYNSGNTLSRTIDSIEKQTWVNTELIIVNDGSTDEATNDLLDYFSTKPNITVYSQSNKGLASARNSGIRISKGEYILPLDSDDWINNNAIKIMLDTYKQGDLNSVVFSDIKLHGTRDRVKTTYCNSFEQLFSNQLPYCMFFPKVIFEKFGGYDENLRLGLEDWEFNIRLITSKLKFVKLNEPVFNYNVSNSGMLKSTTMKSYSTIWRYISKKNYTNYGLKELFNIYHENKNKPSNRPLQLYFAYFFLSKFIPQKLFDFFIYSLYRSQTFLCKINLSKNGK
jgi:glycosyltransferase involved in cell wall biosynthesis